MVLFFPGERTGGWGFVVRYGDGEVLATGMGNFKYTGSALQTEAITALKGLQQVANRGMSRIILESDATTLASALISSELDRSTIGCIINQIIDLMRFEFVTCQISICNRSCNRVADRLASYGACDLASDSAVLLSYAPEFVTDFVYDDLPRGGT